MSTRAALICLVAGQIILWSVYLLRIALEAKP
jgi:hypothetical protein